MTINIEALNAAIRAQPPQKPSSLIERIISSIHSNPELRGWITLESESLPPIYLSHKKSVACLIAVRTPDKAAFQKPWAAIELSVPDGGVVQKYDLRDKIEKSLPETIPDQLFKLDPVDQVKVQKTFFEQLDKFVSTGTMNDNLISLYRRILSEEAIQWYKAIFSEGINTQTEIVESIEENLGNFFRRGRRLAEKLKATSILSSLENLNSRRHSTSFSIAVVGAFNTGKSSLVGRLLDRPDLLPTSDVESTAILTSVRFGGVDKIDVYFANGTSSQRPLVPESWSDLSATTSHGELHDVHAEAVISINDGWLRELDVVFVDTPGLEDSSEQHAAVSLQAVMQCNAALLTIAAGRPFARSEQAFLEEDIIRRGGVAKVAVILTKIDLIPENERKAVINSTKAKVAAVSTAIPVFAVSSFLADTDVASLKNYITTISDRRGRLELRSRQITQQLLGSIDEIDSFIEIGRQLAARDDASKEKMLIAFEDKLNNADIKWLDIKNLINQARQACAKNITDNLMINEGDVIERYEHELKSVPDPKLWWERDLPFRMRRELMGLHRQVEQSLRTRLMTDFQGLRQAIINIYDGTIQDQGNDINLAMHDELLPLIQVKDVRRMRLLTRLGTGAVVLGAGLLVGPFVMAASVFAGLLSEKWMTEAIEDQRPKMQIVLDRYIKQAFSHITDQTTSAVRTAYAAMLEAAEGQVTAWQRIQKEAYANNVVPNFDWNEVSSESQRLRNDIEKVLVYRS